MVPADGFLHFVQVAGDARQIRRLIDELVLRLEL